jgi:hypothetical protein
MLRTWMLCYKEVISPILAAPSNTSRRPVFFKYVCPLVTRAFIVHSTILKMTAMGPISTSYHGICNTLTVSSRLSSAA